LKRYKPLQRSQKPIKRITPKRAKERREYLKLNREYLKSHPICAVCKTAWSNQVHHIAGCIGPRLNDVSQWLAVCQGCHDRIGREGKWAREMGFRTL
jgi:hypothetical protein